MCDTNLKYEILGLKECDIFYLDIYSKDCIVTHEDIVLYHNVSPNTSKSLYFKVKNNYQIVQPDYINAVNTKNIRELKTVDSDLIGEINSIKNGILRVSIK